MAKSFSGLFVSTWDTFKPNWILLVPQAAYLFLMGFLYGVFYFCVYFALIVIGPPDNKELFMSMLLPVGIIMGAIFLILMFLMLLISLFYQAGWLNMFKNAVTQGKAFFRHFWEGIQHYFWRILGIWLVSVVIGIVVVGLVIGSFVGLIVGIGLAAFKHPSFWLILSLIGLIIFWVLALFVLGLFLMMWYPACVIEDISVFSALAKSIRFGWHNFLILLGFIGAGLVAGIACGFAWMLMWPAIIFINTYFMLLYFVTYQDRTRVAVVEEPGEKCREEKA